MKFNLRYALGMGVLAIAGVQPPDVLCQLFSAYVLNISPSRACRIFSLHLTGNRFG